MNSLQFRSGNLLAFIKRTLFVTSLILHNLSNGNEVVLNSNLDFDQQESYAPAGIFENKLRVVFVYNHNLGVYPGFAFNQDDTAIIVWAKGYINEFFYL